MVGGGLLVVGPILCHIGPMLAHLGPMLRPSWGYVRPSWAYVSPSWAHVAPILGQCSPILGLCWGHHCQGPGQLTKPSSSDLFASKLSPSNLTGQCLTMRMFLFRVFFLLCFAANKNELPKVGKSAFCEPGIDLGMGPLVMKISALLGESKLDKVFKPDMVFLLPKPLVMVMTSAPGDNSGRGGPGGHPPQPCPACLRSSGFPADDGFVSFLHTSLPC